MAERLQSEGRPEPFAQDANPSLHTPHIDATEDKIPTEFSPRSEETLAESLGQYENLDELAAVPPVENPDEAEIYRHRSLEETRSQQQARRQSLVADQEAGVAGLEKAGEPSELAITVYTLSYLVFFAILGTLARVGLAALTTYPGAPAITGTLWANFAGSLIMGFLIEDRMLFSVGSPSPVNRKKTDDTNGSSGTENTGNWEAAKKKHLALKKTIPLYIGLATGFCGSFTSFSSFIKDTFLAISNDLVSPDIMGSPTPRNGGYSFMAMLAVIILTVSLSLSALFIGAHLAIGMEFVFRPVNFLAVRRIADPAVVVLGWGCWLGAIFLAIFPPHDRWRGEVLFSLIFGPLGCFARFYLSLYLNGKIASFPLGTFAANIIGTMVLGMAWDIAHANVGGVIGCQVLQGVEDGFCGCLTTISTWVSELSSLRKRHSYLYGTTSVVVALVSMIAIMGGLKWSEGFSGLVCTP
ncbi:unnamed protein product [Clonostachys rosea]|uniref:Chromosome condensation protein (CrcB) n=1 Tax=Bionectria ochroleuca TaxID=29856 RepID=A0ABY6UW43_BIOOC|nr:unnamed protein product [Clonostachys rosea]